jgi:hypothetical protein
VRIERLPVHPDHYLDVRKPEWRRLERRGRVRGSRSLVWVHPAERSVCLELARRWPTVYMPPALGAVLRLFDGEAPPSDSGVSA